MTNAVPATQQLFAQLQRLLARVGGEAYRRGSAYLSGATIGQHVRHIVELFVALHQGYASGVVNYDKRDRDRRIETDPWLAIALLDGILETLQRPDKPLLLQAMLDAGDTGAFTAASSYYRELAFNIDHTVHHMALIRVGVLENTDIILPASFGVAAATIKHQQSCAR